MKSIASKIWQAFIAYMQGPKVEEPKTTNDAIRQMSQIAPF